MKRAIFLDRDGVINKKAPEGDYVTRWEDFEFLPGIAEAIAEINRARIRVIVVTNQRCVAKGLVTSADLEALHRRMREVLAEHGAMIDAIYYCPHDVDPRCRCRKPSPGLLFDAARDFEIELAGSWMVGDSELDVTAGKNAGCKTAFLLSDKGTVADGEQRDYNADLVGNSPLDIVTRILDCERRDTELKASGAR